MGDESDHELAMRLPREAFAEQRPFYFLVSVQPFRRPRQPGRTAVHDAITAVGDPDEPPPDTSGSSEALPALQFDASPTIADVPRLDDDGGQVQLFAVRKVGTMFESMVTVGRTQNNDICLADVQVSRFHCFFKLHADRVEIGDAGSSNGTVVGDRRLSKGVLAIVIPGDVIRLGQLELEFLEAGQAWDRVHRR